MPLAQTVLMAWNLKHNCILCLTKLLTKLLYLWFILSV